jgi:hypothetical protein
MSELNIYAKVQQVKVDLQKKNIKKSGNNGFTKQPYFTLPDFLPTVNELFLKHNLHSMITFTTEQATLTITDIDKPDDKLIYTSPVAEAGLKNGTSIQNLGAIQTYIRRYLIVNALDIAESDFDGNTEPDPDDSREMLLDMIKAITSKESAKKTKCDEYVVYYDKDTLKDCTDNQLTKIFNKLNEKKEVTNE